MRRLARTIPLPLMAALLLVGPGSPGSATVPTTGQIWPRGNP